MIHNYFATQVKGIKIIFFFNSKNKSENVHDFWTWII